MFPQNPLPTTLKFLTDSGFLRNHGQALGADDIIQIANSTCNIRLSVGTFFRDDQRHLIRRKEPAQQFVL